jgi:tartrate dehydratase beta subunit/fumarate hydratase class I family protein
MVNIANQTLSNYVDNLDETSKKEFIQLMSEDTKSLEGKFETIRESAISKLKSILEKEEELELKTKLSETIDRLKTEKFDQLNFLKLKNLEESI